jgi:large subunit ribosomal protein L24
MPGVRNKPAARIRVEIKKEDTVKVISGRDKGKTGRVLRVEHVMMAKRHTRPNPGKQIKGGIAEREAPIAVSNLMVVCPNCGKATRIGHHSEPVPGGGERRTRVCRKCGQALDRK